MNEKIVYKNKWISVKKKNNFYTVDENLNHVTIIPVIDNNKLVLVKQFRPAIRKYTLEFPGGRIEKNELSKKGAIRELFEETGILIKDSKKLIKLSTISVDPSRNTKFPEIYYYNVPKKEFPKKNNEKNKEIDKVKIVGFKSFLTLCNKRKIISSYMICLFFLYLLKKKIKVNV